MCIEHVQCPDFFCCRYSLNNTIRNCFRNICMALGTAHPPRMSESGRRMCLGYKQTLHHLTGKFKHLLNLASWGKLEFSLVANKGPVDSDLLPVLELTLWPQPHLPPTCCLSDTILSGFFFFFLKSNEMINHLL